MIKSLSLFSLTLACGLICQGAAHAWPMSFSAQDGSGEEISIKKGWFGNQEKMVKDRLGDGYASKKGIFGTRQKQVSLLGNSVSTKKGLLPWNREIQAHTMLGDSFTTRKHWWGRTTSVNAGGLGNLIDQSFKGKFTRPGMPPLPNANQGPLAPQINAPAQSAFPEQPAPASMGPGPMPAVSGYNP